VRDAQIKPCQRGQMSVDDLLHGLVAVLFPGVTDEQIQRLDGVLDDGRLGKGKARSKQTTDLFDRALSFGIRVRLSKAQNFIIQRLASLSQRYQQRDIAVTD
jgi:hypothetical protein